VTEILGICFVSDRVVYKPIVALYEGADKLDHLTIYGFTKDEFSETLMGAHKGVLRLRF
jgi:hypothetical protein